MTPETAIAPEINPNIIPEIIYPIEDGEPLAESYEHLRAIFNIFSALTQYLSSQQALVLSNQFLFYSQGYPKLRVAPDVMVIFDVAPGGRPNYKIWEEGQVPKVIFEITSPSTRRQDQGLKYDLYEQLGVAEYWLFDPKGEWIPEKLKGYKLYRDTYEFIENNISQALQLELKIEGQYISFYRLDNQEKLLAPDELFAALQQSQVEAEQEKLRIQQAIPRLRELGLSLEQIANTLGMSLDKVQDLQQS